MSEEITLGWYAVRCVIDIARDVGAEDHAYEERITLWHAASFDEAMERAQLEATEYAGDPNGASITDLVQAYHLFDEPADGAEVFSLIRVSSLPPETYVTEFFDTGTERQHT